MCNIYRLYVLGVCLCHSFGRVSAFVGDVLPRIPGSSRRPVIPLRGSRSPFYSKNRNIRDIIHTRKAAHWECSAVKAWNLPERRDSRLYSALCDYRMDLGITTRMKRLKMAIVEKWKKCVDRLFRFETHAPPIVCLAASCAYLVPYFDVTQSFGRILASFDVPSLLKRIVGTSLLISSFYSSVPFLSQIFFSFIYLTLVKKNQLNIHYFIRYNFLQGLILSTFQQVVSMLFLNVYPLHIYDDFVSQVTFFTVLLASYGSIIYSGLSALIGKFPDLPILSDAVKMHIGDELH